MDSMDSAEQLAYTLKMALKEYDRSCSEAEDKYKCLLCGTAGEYCGSTVDLIVVIRPYMWDGEDPLYLCPGCYTIWFELLLPLVQRKRNIILDHKGYPEEPDEDLEQLKQHKE